MNYRERQTHVVVKWHGYFKKWRKVLCGYRVRCVRRVTEDKTNQRRKIKLGRLLNAMSEGSDFILNHTWVSRVFEAGN